MSTQGYPLVPLSMKNEAQHRQALALTTNNAAQGKINVSSQVTLAAGATTTTVKDSRIGATTVISFCPLTADAAAALSGLYVSAQVKGQMTLTHANTASTDRTFAVTFIG
ncbi:hypothetical protein [Pararobbsia silviterrae]|uniref:Uncharacterized protein n=1 Tax=Pararobbsia silviterrae TaxID=1792498 RepID=A0A494Y8X9_9BURK|nr:hypothetical protein [Pararobbsia silviterrae]RKP56360.1 hypothetical protein D7S86_08145 [Pararobbsia silviterrae]